MNFLQKKGTSYQWKNEMSNLKSFVYNIYKMAWQVQLHRPDEVARIGALSIGPNGQKSFESASMHFEPICGRPSPQAKSRS
ncbi:MAG TPA: hypothetical protein VEW69_08575 [Alphaproteobacteria bacterium]|nr:hypothetical protein [Alphaproteobacteria bacterium]